MVWVATDSGRRLRVQSGEVVRLETRARRSSSASVYQLHERKVRSLQYQVPSVHHTFSFAQVTCVHVNPDDSNYVTTASLDRTAKVRECLQPMPCAAVLTLHWGQVWDVRKLSKTKSRPVTTITHTLGVTSAQFAPVRPCRFATVAACLRANRGSLHVCGFAGRDHGCDDLQRQHHSSDACWLIICSRCSAAHCWFMRSNVGCAARIASESSSSTTTTPGGG